MIISTTDIDNSYELRNSTLHGFGLFAKRHITAGEELAQDKPIWLIGKDEIEKCYPFKRRARDASDGLLCTLLRYMNYIGEHYGPAHREKCLSDILTLHKGFTSYEEAKELWERDGSAFVKKLSDIFIYNAIGQTTSSPMREEERPFCGIFVTAARINHSCVPNVDVRVRRSGKGTAMARVIAVRDIEKDEEITRAYVCPILPTADRQERLRFSWDIECRCALCARRPDLRAASDGRRLRLREACARIERCREALQTLLRGPLTGKEWREKRDELCDEILGDRNIGGVEDVWEREQDLSDLYFFESFGVALLAADLQHDDERQKRYLRIMIKIQDVLQVIEPEAADHLFARRDLLDEET